jgi:hypothetical protein
MKLQQSVCLTTALLVLAVTGLTTRAGEPAVNPTGTWKWTAPQNPDGKTPNITFTLKLQGETLTGTVNKSTSTTTITNGVVKGDEVSFQTVREGISGKTTTTYSGILSGDTIRGNIETDVDKAKVHAVSVWEAKRVKE